MSGSVLGLLLSSLALVAALEMPINYCLLGPVPAEKDLDNGMKLPYSYKLDGTITDWLNQKTTYFTETSVNGATALSLMSKDTQTRLVQLENEHFSVNDTHCLLEKNLDPFNVTASARTYLNATDSSSISAIVENILTYSHKFKGILNATVLVAGVEGVRWFNCINNTATNKTLQIEVIFTDKGSLPLPEFNNPQMMFIRLSEFALGDNGTSPFTSSISLSIDKRTTVDSQDSSFDIPDGVLCDGRNSTPLSASFPDPVNLVIQNATLFYSPKKNLAVVQTAKVNKAELIPFFGLAAADSADTFVHDYFLGYEYSLANIRCQAVREISKSSVEVKLLGEKISLGDINDILGNLTLSWQEYTEKAVPVYRARGTNGDVLQLRKNGNSIEIRTYANGLLKGNVTITQLTTVVTPQVFQRVRDCFAKQTGANSSFMFSVKDKSMKDVLEAGEAVVISSLATAFRDLGLENNLRVKAIFTDDPVRGLNVFFKVANKFDVVPTETTSNYNRSVELSTNDFFDRLNQTMTVKDWSFKVNDQSWTASKSSLSRYPPPPNPPSPPSFIGYTGGSMFVLGLFSLIFGAAIGAGALFFVTRRQRISTLAYQVFE